MTTDRNPTPTAIFALCAEAILFRNIFLVEYPFTPIPTFVQIVECLLAESVYVRVPI